MKVQLQSVEVREPGADVAVTTGQERQRYLTISLHPVTFFEGATRFGGLFGGRFPISRAR
jgi:hypothetical protein